MENLLKLVRVIGEIAPQAFVDIEGLKVLHHFSLQELMDMCNKYNDNVPDDRKIPLTTPEDKFQND